MIDEREFTELDSLKIWRSQLGWHWECVNKFNGKLASGIEPSFNVAVDCVRAAFIFANCKESV